jgi:hypothetical protein
MKLHAIEGMKPYPPPCHSRVPKPSPR